VQATEDTRQNNSPWLLEPVAELKLRDRGGSLFQTRSHRQVSTNIVFTPKSLDILWVQFSGIKHGEKNVHLEYCADGKNVNVSTYLTSQ